MAHLAGHVPRAPQQPTVGNDARAHAGAHGEEHHILAAPARTVLPLHQRAGVGVVLQKGRNVECVLQNLHDGHLVPARQVRRRLHHAGAGVQRPSAAHADGLHRRVRFADQLLRRRKQPVPRVFKAQLRVGLKADLAYDFNLFTGIRQQHRTFRAANVQSKHAHPVNASHSVSKSGFPSGYHSAVGLSTDGFFR